MLKEVYFMLRIRIKKRFGSSISKDVFFILEGRRIFLNIRNKNDSIFLYGEDLIEKRIKEILWENSQLNIRID